MSHSNFLSNSHAHVNNFSKCMSSRPPTYHLFPSIGNLVITQHSRLGLCSETITCLSSNDGVFSTSFTHGQKFRPSRQVSLSIKHYPWSFIRVGPHLFHATVFLAASLELSKWRFCLLILIFFSKAMARARPSNLIALLDVMHQRPSKLFWHWKLKKNNLTSISPAIWQ